MLLNVAQPQVYIEQIKYSKKKINVMNRQSSRDTACRKYPEGQQLSGISDQMSGIHG